MQIRSNRKRNLMKEAIRPYHRSGTGEFQMKNARKRSVKALQKRYWHNMELLYGKSVPSRFHEFEHSRQQFNDLLSSLCTETTVKDNDEQEEQEERNHDNEREVVILNASDNGFTGIGVLAVWSLFQRYHEAFQQLNGIDLSFPLCTFSFSQVSDESTRIVLQVNGPSTGATLYFPYEGAFVDYVLCFDYSEADASETHITHKVQRRCQSMHRCYIQACQKARSDHCNEICKSKESQKKMHFIKHRLPDTMSEQQLDGNMNLLGLAALRYFYGCLLNFLNTHAPQRQTARTFFKIVSAKTTKTPNVQRFQNDLRKEITTLQTGTS